MSILAGRIGVAFLFLFVATVGLTEEAVWKPAPTPLKTRWADSVSPDSALLEYPRPQMVRREWTNLNGLWDYAITEKTAPRPHQFAEKILVPFPIESSLSGVGKRVSPGDRLWYRREFKIPGMQPQGRLLLHFGAVDWDAVVYVNGKLVGDHRGGYASFSIDITSALDARLERQELMVGVCDPTDAGFQARGKQVRKPEGIWYTPTSGIWQTVWLEPTPAQYIRGLTITPDLDRSQVVVIVDADPGTVSLEIRDAKNERVATVVGRANTPIRAPIPGARAWSPSNPYLYDLSVRYSDDSNLHADQVESYFGLRKVSLGKDEKGVTRVMLNNQFVFQTGLLDQGFWPDGLYTAPSDEALKYDLLVTKDLGFNMIRKHVKVEPDRWYYHCDKLGILVWQDMPSGDRYIGPNDPDIERDSLSREHYLAEWSAIIDQLRNHPSIVMWVPFNEGWGQFQTAEIAEFTRQLDDTRLVNATSGWSDRGVGDVNDIHVYPGPGIPPLEAHRAAILGEFGGLGLPLEGHTWQGKDNWGYRSFPDMPSLGTAFSDLYTQLTTLRDQGLSASVYTQTTDVEIEVNGLMTYDRAVLKFDPVRLRALNSALTHPATTTSEASASDKP